jgi:DNA polymerase I
LNAVSTYLDSFVKGIQRWTRPDGLLHAQFNQTTTRTGRLSSSNPNFQNQPKGGKFPVRKAVISRFEGGHIIEADFSGLEFRVAGELSRDPQIIEDILSGKDVHKQTAMIINQCDLETVTKDMRQGAKAYTFAPLYGGMGALEPPHIQTYFREYFNIYKGLSRWHQSLMDGVLKTGIVRIPSGREFYFPNSKRLRSGRITGATMVVNYPVQSFATGDIVPLACIRALRKFKELGLKSQLVLTVHDSIVVDCHPGEGTEVRDALKWAMSGVSEEVESRFGYSMVLPLAIEISKGPNWMELKEIPLDE